MLLKEIHFKNFRNLSTQSIHLSTGIHFFIGKNGQGKTSLLEAAGFLSTMTSFKHARPEDCIRENESTASVYGTVFTSGLELACGIELERTLSGSKKKGMHNGKPVARRSEYLTRSFGGITIRLHSISFNPSDHELVNGEPELRRKYLDRTISSEDPFFSELLQKQQRITDQRNQLLKRFVEFREPIHEGAFEVLTEQWIELSSKLVTERLKWIHTHNRTLQIYLNTLSEAHDPIELKYIAKNTLYCGQGEAPSIEFFRDLYQKKCVETRALERALGSTQFGPSRDDWVLCFREKPLKNKGSQGEIRSALMALKLAEVASYRERTGEKPLFLLDDFSSELDQERRTRLIHWLKETDLQSLVSTTDIDASFGHRYRVQDGMFFKD